MGTNGLFEEDPDDDAQQPLSIAEIVSELIYAQKPLSEIAGYDTMQLRWVVARKRDKYGNLIRKTGLPPWVEVDANGMRIVSNPKPFNEMFRQVKVRTQKYSVEEAKKQWDAYLKDNPKLGTFGEDN